MKRETYDVWRVTYGTCGDVLQYGDIPPRLIAMDLPLEKAITKAESLGWDHCAKPSELRKKP